jgi:hypothetical protein
MNRRQFASSLALLGATALLAACEPTLPRRLSRDYSAVPDTPLPDRALLNEVMDITTANQHQINRILVSSGQDTRIVGSAYRAVPISGTPTGEQSLTIGMDYSLEKRDGRAYFPPGEYDLFVSRVRTGGAVFATFIGNTLEDIARLLHDFDVRLTINYYGNADGLPVRSLLTYQGEFGNVQIPASQLSLNGTPTRASYRPGQRLDNPDLAILRAYGTGYYIRGRAKRGGVDHLITQEHYYCATTKQIGQQYRSVRVELEIRQRPRYQGWTR